MRLLRDRDIFNTKGDPPGHTDLVQQNTVVENTMLVKQRAHCSPLPPKTTRPCRCQQEVGPGHHRTLRIPVDSESHPEILHQLLATNAVTCKGSYHLPQKMTAWTSKAMQNISPPWTWPLLASLSLPEKSLPSAPSAGSFNFRLCLLALPPPLPLSNV